MGIRISNGPGVLILCVVAASIAACGQPSNPTMAGSSQGAAPDNTLAGAAGDIAGGGCVPTSQGLPRLATVGDGPVVLRAGQPVGTVARGPVQQPPQEGGSCP